MYNSIYNRLKKNGYSPENILDIGACKGTWSNEIFPIYPQAKYFLFEPINYPELEQYRNRQNFTVFNELLGESESNVDWYERQDTGDSIYKEISHHYDNVIPVKKPLKTLNTLINFDLRKILVKIDCQGSEISILKGASNLYNNVDFIILEAPFFGSYNYGVKNFQQHVQFMDEIGFTVFDFIENHSINNFTMQVDMMFINKNHHFNSIVQDRLQIKNYNIDNVKTVAFLSNKLTLRGTEVAIFDYADYNERILGNKSIIITRDYEKIKHEWDVDIQAYNKFKDRFEVYYYASQPDIDQIVINNAVTHIFIEKAGLYTDYLFSNYCKNIIHCVFDVSQPHGDVYTPLGQTINNISNTNFPVTPYMVILPDCNDNLRKELNIPENAIVFGRYGGKESFDINFVYDVIKNIVNSRDDIYFLFMNTNVFYEHKNIIYLPGNADMLFKRKFINTCDALIHARGRGETFGLTCGEFAICKKPVITWGNSYEKEHLLILKEKAVMYNTPEDLTNILDTFNKDKYDMSENGYMFYNPKNVMKIFNEVCLI
jgi:FkbM family methyltransferase